MNYLKYIIKYLKHSQTLVLIITIYQANVVPKVSFFVASDVVPNVYNKSWRLLSFNEIIQMKHLRKHKLELSKHLQDREFKNCKKWSPAYKDY